MFVRGIMLDVFYKIIARQLARPSGVLARRTGKKMNKSNLLLYKLMFDNLKFNDNDSILEIGFGNGKFFKKLNEMATKLQINGIDLSHNMVVEAVKNNTKLYEDGALHVKVGSSDKMPFAKSQFDVVYCINVVYFWDNPEKHLSEIRRVLKPGGYFSVGLRPKENMELLPFTKYGFTLYSEDEWRNILINNGFVNVQATRQTDSPTLNTEKKMFALESLCFVCQNEQ